MGSGRQGFAPRRRRKSEAKIQHAAAHTFAPTQHPTINTKPTLCVAALRATPVNAPEAEGNLSVKSNRTFPGWKPNTNDNNRNGCSPYKSNEQGWIPHTTHGRGHECSPYKSTGHDWTPHHANGHECPPYKSNSGSPHKGTTSSPYKSNNNAQGWAPQNTNGHECSPYKGNNGHKHGRSTYKGNAQGWTLQLWRNTITSVVHNKRRDAHTQWKRRTSTISDATTNGSSDADDEDSRSCESSFQLKVESTEASAAFEEHLEYLIDAIQPSAAQQEICKRALLRLKDIAARHFSSASYRAHVKDPDFDGSCRVLPYGSYKQRTHIVGSDLDVVLVIPCGRSDYHGRRETYARHLESFKRALTSEFVFNKLIPAKVPVLKVLYHNIPLDITVTSPEEYRAFHRDVKVADMTAPRLDGHGERRATYQSFLRLVKYWSKQNGINDAFTGFLNSTSWTFLGLCYLNLLGKEIEPEAVTYKTLLEGFFEFMVALGDGSHVIDALAGTVKPNSEPWVPYPLIIRDPYTGNNMAGALQVEKWRHTIAICLHSANASKVHA